MEFLHKYGLIHRDIKPNNIIINEHKFELKLIDFGISKRIHNSKTSTQTEKKGTLLYEAPENFGDLNNTDQGNADTNSSTKSNNKLSKVNISTKFDVWSFGLILNQIFGCERPWNGLDSNRIMFNLSKKEEFPVSENIYNEDIKDLVRSCTIVEPKERMTISEVKKVLKSVLVNRLVDLSKVNKVENLFIVSQQSLTFVTKIKSILCK